MRYVSQRKIHALEDSILFAPYLFSLHKSIFMSAPVQGLFGGHGLGAA